MTTAKRVVLKPKRAQPFFYRHPWLFAGAIDRVEGEPADGDAVDVVSHGDTLIARGLYNSRSQLRVRLMTWEPGEEIDGAFFRRRLATALELRRDRLGLVAADAGYRLCSSEADGVPGLTVDVYAGFAVAQFTSLGVARRQAEVVDAIREAINPRGIYLRTERGIGSLEGVDLHDGPLWGEVPPDDLTIVENGLRFRVNLASGQKTGYYLDQRDNRQAVARHARGRRVLDAFSYSGGFGLHALRAGAASVTAVDGSAGALELLKANAELNGLPVPHTIQGDVFDELETLQTAGEQFGVVVLDPPKFARSRSAVNEALKGYRRLATLGIRLMPAGGILCLCCCSGVVEPTAIDEVLAQVAVGERRDAQLLERRGAAADHPVSLACPETAYLKCLIVRIGAAGASVGA